MSDFDVRNIPDAPPPDDEPIPFDDSDDQSESIISNSPLDLSSSGAVSMEQEPSKPTVPKEIASSTDRITGMKVFFTKLHAGSLNFLTQQINEWLSENPGVVIKRTNVTVGDVISKKTEPNLIITIWY